MANVISKVKMILWLLSLYAALVAACGERPRDLDSARREAIGTFKGDINKYNIDPIFFKGPSAVTETPNEFVFE